MLRRNRPGWRPVLEVLVDDVRAVFAGAPRPIDLPPRWDGSPQARPITGLAVLGHAARRYAADVRAFLGDVR